MKKRERGREKGREKERDAAFDMAFYPSFTLTIRAVRILAYACQLGAFIGAKYPVARY